MQFGLTIFEEYPAGKLHNCVFCGAPAEVKEIEKNAYRVVCTDPKCREKYGKLFAFSPNMSRKEDAEREWNENCVIYDVLGTGKAGN